MPGSKHKSIQALQIKLNEVFSKKRTQSFVVRKRAQIDLGGVGKVKCDQHTLYIIIKDLIKMFLKETTKEV